MRSCRVLNLNKTDLHMEQFCEPRHALAVFSESVEDAMKVPLRRSHSYRKRGVNGAFAPSRL
jgi:hypothetical protein